VAVQARSLTCPPLLALLADGRVHSGEALAQRLSMSRTGIWKGIERLRAHHIDVAAIPRSGYSLPHAVELLDAAKIERVIGASQRETIEDLAVHFEVGSTNTLLLDEQQPARPGARIVLAELQTAGRGRLGRSWLAPFGSGIALSVAWNFADTPNDLPALSLAVGVAITRGLARLGANTVKLKWPNDVWLDDRKLGGVLIELRVEAGGPAMVVIGIGINVNMPAALRASIERDGVSPADLGEVCPDASRNAVAGAVIDEVLIVLAAFARDGFAPFREEWIQLDALCNRHVDVLLGKRKHSGVAAGIDRDGRFILRGHPEADGMVRESKFISGEVSLRLSAGNSE
jgi:BirA family transcriptional regulator, biotin operon repressor / biotin---[acetyl-CoA-carboxylase] ligase